MLNIVNDPVLMDVLQVLISDIPDPVFIINRDNREVLIANEKATSNAHDPVGEIFEDVVHIEENEGTPPIVFYNNRWFRLIDQPFQWKNQSFHKIVLKKQDFVPAPEALQVLRDMTEVLLHHLRSPLTGMQGYMRMMEEEMRKKPTEKLLKVWDRGLRQLFGILDELEVLYKIPLDINEQDSFTAEPDLILNEVFLNFSSDNRDRVLAKTSGTPKTYRCNPVFLKNILTLLIENALDHSSRKDIVIVTVAEESITVSNTGSYIPEAIAEKMFYPFVTTKATKLGIGLTKALLYASQFGGSLFLSENSKENGVAITLRFPPQ